MLRKVLFFISCLIILAGCVEMRDYTDSKDGAFRVFAKQGFGSGQELKDYYVIDDDLSIIVRDTKNEILAKLGTPDKIERTVAGYDCWTYKARGLNLFFQGNHLKRWERL